MSELTGPVTLLVWAGGVSLALGLVRSLGPLTYKVAEAAIEAQQHSFSYGQYSRMLWSNDRGHHTRQFHR